MTKTRKSLCWKCVSYMLIVMMICNLSVGRLSAASKAKVTSIKVTNVTGTLKIAKGKVFSLKTEVKASPNKSANKKVTYLSKNSAVATVNAKGKVKARKSGTTSIVICSKVNPNKKKTIRVKVVSLVSSITLSDTELTLAEDDDDYQLSAKVSPKDAVKDVEWMTSDEDIVDVDEDGVVYPMNEGTATITVLATDGSGKKATCKVTITPGSYDDDDDDEEDDLEDDDIEDDE